MTDRHEEGDVVSGWATEGDCPWTITIVLKKTLSRRERSTPMLQQDIARWWWIFGQLLSEDLGKPTSLHPMVSGGSPRLSLALGLCLACPRLLLVVQCSESLHKAQNATSISASTLVVMLPGGPAQGPSRTCS